MKASHFFLIFGKIEILQQADRPLNVLCYSLMFVLCFQGFDIASRSWITIFQIANFKINLETWIAWHRKRLGLIIDSK